MKIDKWINGSKALAGSLLCCLALAGCVREKFNEAGSEAETRTYGLGFMLSADALTPNESNFRYGNELENYINASQLRILFLDKEGNFRFEFSQYVPKDPAQKEDTRLKRGLRLEPLRLNSGDAVSQWFVRIPIDELDENDELKLITEEGFKIAVLANWPDDTFDGDTYGSLNTNFLKVGSEQNIANRLAHCHYDAPYTRDKIYDSYEPFLGADGGDSGELNQMSVSMDWVNPSFSKEDYSDAEEYIRRNFNPYPKDGKRPYLVAPSGHTYYNMWYIWNFGGSKNEGVAIPGDHPYYEVLEGVDVQDWLERNDKEGWAPELAEIAKSTTTEEPIEDVTVYKTYSGLPTGEHDGVIFASMASPDYTAVDTPDGRAVMMPCMDANTWTKHKAGEKVYELITAEQIKNGATNAGFGYFKIPLAADGILRFKVGALLGKSGNHKVAVGIHYGANASFDTNKETNIKNRSELLVCEEETEEKDNSLIEVKTIDYTVKITERIQDAFIYALCDNTNDRLLIYEIEYIKAEHLSDIDRDGIAVSKDNPIPMYGIQEFDPIGAYWTPGELFNLSAYTGFQSDKYNYKWVSLLRSVAKVELKIAKAPFHGKKPQYVYMRSMNRTARLNPIDVLTPTNQIWYGDAEHNIAGIVQETSHIQSYGPMYEALDETLPETVKMQRFHNRLAWFFGIWTHKVVGISGRTPGEKWDWNGLEVDYDQSIPSPRVFNPHINRSDYTHFTDENEDNEDGDYWYYSLYVPEKHMTDPNDPGDLSEAPKCLRIEMRWEGVNDDSNLDDNASYRIYFADPDRGGHLAGIYNRDDYENVNNTPGMPYDGAYENDLANLRSFYPIVRNHVYEVTVSGINQGDISYEVRTTANRSVNIEFE